jgi:hypothetical protein
MEKETKQPAPDELEPVPERPMINRGTRVKPKRQAPNDVAPPPSQEVEDEDSDAPGVGPVMINNESTGFDLAGAHPRA